jgi:hypothetical protein
MTDRHALSKLTSLRTVKMQPKHQQEFDFIFESLITELDTPSAFSVVLTEQIAESLFWLKQHNKDKEEIICFAMGEELVKTMLFRDLSIYAEGFTQIIKHIYSDTLDKETKESDLFRVFNKTMEERGLSLDTLRAKAMLARMDKINDLDVVLSRHIQNLRHLQKGLDAFDFKKKMLKRLDLEIEQLTLKNDTLRDQSRKVISQSQ